MKTYRTIYMKNDNRVYKKTISALNQYEARDKIPQPSRLLSIVRINEVGAVIRS